MRSGVAPVLAGILLAVLGVLAVLGGGADDSPGLQGIGVLLVAGAAALAVRHVRGARRAAHVRRRS